MPQNLPKLLKLLIDSQVDFVLVGGFASVLHGSNQSTRDIDICIALSREQIQALQETLKPYNPLHRMSEIKTSFLDVALDPSLKDSFHLTTDLGTLDVIGHIKGVGDFYDVLKNSEEIDLYGGKLSLISLEDLIKSKKTLGRHRDLVTVMELEAIREENKKKNL